MNISRRELRRFQSWYTTQPEAKELKSPFIGMDEKKKILQKLYERFKVEQAQL